MGKKRVMDEEMTRFTQAFTAYTMATMAYGQREDEWNWNKCQEAKAELEDALNAYVDKRIAMARKGGGE